MKRVFFVFVIATLLVGYANAQTTDLYPSITVTVEQKAKAVWAICAFSTSYTNRVTGETIDSPIDQADVLDGTITSDTATWPNQSAMIQYYNGYLLNEVLRRQYKIVYNRVLHAQVVEDGNFDD